MPAAARLDAAIAAVAAGCAVARSVQRDLESVRRITKDDRSPVTVADFAVQAVVAMELADRLGAVPLIGEEHAAALRTDEHAAVRAATVDAVRRHRPGASEADVLDAIDAGNHDASAAAYWTLDPVDGTKGFLRGGQYAIALAWIDDGTVEIGVMGSPNLAGDPSIPPDEIDARGALFAATRGGGARWCPPDATATMTAIRCAASGDGTIRVCESVERGHSAQDDTRRILAHLGHAGRDEAPVRLDSQCKYAVVARGQADAYLRLPTRADYVEKIWDHAAGAIIADEAGAVVTDVTGRPLDFGHGPRLETNRGVVCAIPSLHARLIDAIAELRIAAPA